MQRFGVWGGRKVTRYLLLLLLLLLLLCFTTQVVEARGDERQKREVKYIDCADGLKA